MKILNKHGVKYLIVGAYAVIYYTEPRYTKDFDIWIKPDKENSPRIYEALKEFGAPLKNITATDFTDKKLFYQIGVAPVRIDIIMNIANLDFEIAWKHKVQTTFEGIKINIIGIQELLKAKKKASRHHLDLADIETLKLKLKIDKRK
ncbi:MAG: nucleotidyltransferase [Elusimicrobia bacterium]|nr:nucleotidyltransferase [Elusimicrobiota bacterium]